MRTRHARRGAAAIALGAVVAAVVPGCTTTSSERRAPFEDIPSTVLSAGEMTRLADNLVRKLSCANRYAYRSDPAFYDPARGFDCLGSDGSAVFIRVYSHSETVGQALDFWGSTLSEGRRWMRGWNWVVMGPAEALSRFRGLPNASGPFSAKPPRIATPTATARLDTCMSVMMSGASQLVLQAKEFASQAHDLDAEIPGASASIQSAVSPRIRRALSRSPDYVIASSLSRFGDRFRRVCARALD